MKTALLALLLSAPLFAQDAPANVTIYRPRHVVGMALHPSIFCDGAELQRLHNGTYLNVLLPTGKHMVTIGRSEVGEFVNFKPGQQYFFRYHFKHMFGAANWTNAQLGTFERVSEERAQREMEKLNPLPVREKASCTPLEAEE